MAEKHVLASIPDCRCPPRCAECSHFCPPRSCFVYVDSAPDPRAETGCEWFVCRVHNETLQVAYPLVDIRGERR